MNGIDQLGPTDNPMNGIVTETNRLVAIDQADAFPTLPANESHRTIVEFGIGSVVDFAS